MGLPARLRDMRRCMVRAIHLAALALLGLGYSGQASLAAPNLAGGTGLIKTPTARVLSDGDITLGFTWIGGRRSYLFRPQTNRMFYVSMGVLPGLELTLDMLQVIGWIDPYAPGVVYAFHRLSAAKYSLPLPSGWPSFAIGTQDPLSANALARGPVGQTRYGLTSYYAVASQALGPLSVHAGYGAPEFLSGLFYGVDLDLGGRLDLRAEFDTAQWNLGLHWQPVPWFGLYGARLMPDDWAYGTALTWRL